MLRDILLVAELMHRTLCLQNAFYYLYLTAQAYHLLAGKIRCRIKAVYVVRSGC